MSYFYHFDQPASNTIESILRSLGEIICVKFKMNGILEKVYKLNLIGQNQLNETSIMFTNTANGKQEMVTR